MRVAIHTILFTGAAVSVLASTPAWAVELGVEEVESFPIGFSVSQIEYAPDAGLLFLREGETALHIYDAGTQSEIAVHLPTEKFTDMDLTGDSRYLFVADYGGERTGYGDPLRPHYVHRYDLQSRTWMIAEAPKMIAWKIEAVSATRVLLQEYDQHVDMTLNSFGPAMAELSRIGSDYRGDDRIGMVGGVPR